MTLSPEFLAGTFVFACAAMVAAYFIRARLFLGLVGFSIPLVSVQLGLGVNVFLFSVVGPLTLLLALAGGKRSFVGHQVRRYWIFLIYVVLLSLLWMTLDYLVLHRYKASMDLGLGVGQTVLKMPVQLVSFATQLVALWIIPSRARNRPDVLAGVHGFTLGCLASVGVGVLLRLTTGVGVLGRPKGAFFGIQSGSIERVGGLSGEPKQLGSLLVIALAFWLAHLAFDKAQRHDRRLLVTILLLALGLILTYSTSAWIGFASVVLAQLGAGIWWQMRGRARKRQVTLIAVLVVALLIVSQSGYMRDVFEARITTRVVSQETAEIVGSKNNLVLDIFSDRPLLAISGLGMGGTDLEAVPYFVRDPKYAAQHRYIRTPTPSTNGVRLLGDIGIIGILLFGFAMWEICKRHIKSGNQALAVFGASGFFGLMFVSINAVSAYLFLVGAGVALLRIERTRNRTVRT